MLFLEFLLAIFTFEIFLKHLSHHYFSILVLQELQRTLDKLKGSINDMQKLNAVLAEGASRERKGPLKVEISEIDKRLDNVSTRLNAKLADLEATIAKWTEYYKRLNNFCEWLNTKESNLNDVFENKSAQPEEQLDKANVSYYHFQVQLGVFSMLYCHIKVEKQKFHVLQHIDKF